jgi:hypothetical protein
MIGAPMVQKFPNLNVPLLDVMKPGLMKCIKSHFDLMMMKHEMSKMDYGDISGNEFRDDEPELNNQLVFVEDAEESSGELMELLNRYE